MELSLTILFYFAYRWKTKIISHKAESFYFHQNIWRSDFIFHVETSIPCNLHQGGFGLDAELECVWNLALAII